MHKHNVMFRFETHKQAGSLLKFYLAEVVSCSGWIMRCEWMTPSSNRVAIYSSL